MSSNTSPDLDVVVVGGGPAGLAAALTLGRSRRRVLVLDAGQPRNRFASHMHGVLGNEGISPTDLLERGRREVSAYGVDVVDGSVVRVDDTDDSLHVSTEDGRRLITRALVVASGVWDELPEVPGLAERWGVTVLHCPYCHGWEVRDAHLGVLTTAPFSLHQAEVVRQWSDSVTVFSHGLGDVDEETLDRLRARGIRLEPAPVTAVSGAGTAIEAVHLDDGRSVQVDALFTIAAPHPNDAFLEPLRLDRTDGPFGSRISVDPAGATSHARVWAVGNVVNPVAQVATAIGSATATAVSVNAALVHWDGDAAVGSLGG